MEKQFRINDKLESSLREIIQQADDLQSQLLYKPADVSLGGLNSLLADAQYALDRARRQIILEERINQITQEQIEEIAGNAERMMEGPHSRTRFHCSEAFVISVGSYLFGEVPDQIRRMVTGLAGGVGGSHEEMCGALVGGILLIGGIYGRARPTEDDQPAYQLSVHYREKFIERLGGAKCHQFRDNGYGSDGHTSCGQLVSRAVKVFFAAMAERSKVLVLEDE